MTTRPDIEVIRQAVDLARRAPSLHNSQPWQFVLSDNGLRLFADPAVRLSEADPTGRQRLIGVGAVLDHLEIALGALGWRSQVTVLPDPNHPDHVATVDLDRADGVTQAHLQRAEAVARRYSHRMPMGPPRDWKVFLPFVCGVLSDRDVEVTTFDAADMPVVRRAARGANLARTYDWRYFTELSWWTASPQSSAVGIPPEVLPTSVEAEHVAVARDFPAAVRLIHGAGADDAAEIVAISTAADQRTWSSLPKEFQLAATTMPADGQLVVQAPGAAPLNISLPPCVNAMVCVRIPQAGAPPAVQIVPFNQ